MKKKKKVEYITRAFSLTREIEAYINRLAENEEQSNASLALRKIINEHKELSKKIKKVS